VLWAGHSALPAGDGWVSLHLADEAALTLPPPSLPVERDTDAALLVDALRAGGGRFFRELVDAVDLPPDQVSALLWGLVWGGRVSNDTLAPVRAGLGGRATRRPPRARPARLARSRFARPGRSGASLPSGPPTLSGRWSLLPAVETDPTVRAHATAQLLLDRHGVLTRGAVAAERVPGGFAAAYRVLSAAEEAGRCRRGYVVAGLGGAQFALPGAVDRLRRYAEGGDRATPGSPTALVLAATDPANPYGAALPWPDPAHGGHRAGRKAGAVVVLTDGRLALYVERGGRTVLSFTDDGADLQAAAHALAAAVRQGGLGRLTVQKADGDAVTAGAVGEALAAAGFHLTPRGLRLRPGS
jgi:ATP-dependent Lhr-like helicase